MKAKLYKDLDFEDEFDYYQYIISSFFNGQRSQMNLLYKNIDSTDKEYFIKEYLPDSLNDNTESINEIKNYLLLN